MIFDHELQMSNRQVALATAYSTDTIDLGQSRPIGYDDLSLAVTIQAESGTSPTLTAELETSSDNSTFTKAGSVVKTSGQSILVMGLEGVKLSRYVRLRYVIGGTSPSYTLTAGIVAGVQAWAARPDSVRQS